MSSTRTLMTFLIAWSATSAAVEAQTQVQDLRERTRGPVLFGEVHRMLPRSRDGAAALGDLDGDGDLDAVIGNRVHRNDGTGLLVAAATLGSPGPGAIALGDVDGDGTLDVFFANRGLNGLFLNEGNGVFRDASSNLPNHTGKTSDVVLGDLDGDGDLDAYVSSWSARGGFDRVYLNDGTGVFTYAQFNLPFSAGGALAVVLGDLDGDGDLDALTAEQDRFMHDVIGRQNRFYRNTGSGVFEDATTRLPAVADKTYALALGDVDGDGDLDALIGNGGNLAPGEQMSLWLNNGNARFTDATSQLPPDTDFASSLAFGDVEGDGDLDALVANTGQSRLYLNDGDGFFTDAPMNLPVESERATCAALRDMDGDADLDAFVTAVGVQNRLYLNDGDGVFVDATGQPRVPRGSTRTNDLAAGDVDGDGDLDVLSATRDRDRLYLNDGLGAFEDALANLPPIDDNTSAVALADVDGDGDLDALTGSKRRDEHLYLNDGDGVFADHSGQLPTIANDVLALAFGDVDGDGHPDAVVGSRLYVNDGAGTFADAAGQLPGALPPANDVTLGDVNADGSLDIVLGSDVPRLLLNDGSGSFANATAALPPLGRGSTNAVALGDVEQDGDLDLVIGLNRFFGGGNGSIGGGAVMGPVGRDHLYRNDGAGVFADATALFPDTTETVADVALADVDGDGDLDAVLGATGMPFATEPNRLYLNDGNGGFTDATDPHLERASDRTLAVLAQDFDGDGDADLWFGNMEEDRLYTNLSRQLAWGTLPRVGDPLVLDLYGPAFGKWLLAAALDTGRTSHPAFGTFQLDAATFQIMGFGFFDSNGRASASLDVPPELDLVGTTLYWQTSHLDGRLFSNVEETTLSDL